LLLDSHCHPEDRAELERARSAGVSGLVAIAALDFARAHQDMDGLRVWTTLGIHPHEASSASEAAWEAMRRDAADPLVVAIGEIGLDYHYDHSPRLVQLEAFERQLALAAECALPVSIHCRDAWADCFDRLARYPAVRGVFHCFTGSQAEADRALALGWHLSFSGMITFPKLAPLLAVAAAAPAERILIETDSPYLAPVPYRGHRNEPARVREVAAALAHARGLSPADLASLTSANFFALFQRASAFPPRS